MPLRTGIAAMAVALAFAGAVFAFASLGANEPAVKAATRDAGEPLKSSDPGVDPEKEPRVALPTTEEAEPKPMPQVRQPHPEPAPKPAPEPDPEPEPDVAAARAPEPASQPEPPAEPEDPKPSKGPGYTLPDGAIMALTVDAIGLREVPVFDSTRAWALKAGVGHAPETSLPWTDSPHKNTYIAGHRVGFPGAPSDRVFDELGDLGKGDEVLLRGEGGKQYRYEVTESFTASAEDSWVMSRVRDTDMVTLQTCVGPNFSERLIVRAERV